MDLQRIVSELKWERDRIERAIVALEGRSVVTAITRKVGRKARKHRFSAESRRRVSETMKKRWAARRRSNGSKVIPKAA